MGKAKRWLILLLRIDAVVMLSAIGSAIMPFSWMNATHEAMGLGELTWQPVVEYLARSASLLYVLVGALQLFISFDVRKYMGFIKFLMVMRFLIGLLLIWVDWKSDMPLYWTLSEGIAWLVLSGVLLWLCARAEIAGDKI
ncbi:MAG: hypothetical protein ACLFUS_11670 [Candidatus Sumerlaeia bacterium]